MVVRTIDEEWIDKLHQHVGTHAAHEVELSCAFGVATENGRVANVAVAAFLRTKTMPEQHIDYGGGLFHTDRCITYRVFGYSDYFAQVSIAKPHNPRLNRFATLGQIVGEQLRV